MTSLDLRSFNFLAALQCAVMGAVLLGIRHNFPSNIKGLRYWGLAPLLALGATGFYALLGHAPAVLVGLGGNGLLMACTVALLAGTREFLGQPWRWWPWVALVLGCLAGLTVFFVVWPDYRPRMLIFGLGMAAICAAHTQVLARHGRGFAARLMLLAMAWQTLVLVTRALSTYWIDAPDTQRFDAGSVIHMVFVATFSFSILLVLVSAQLMASERVRQEFEHLASHDELTGALNRRAILRLAEQAHARWQHEGQAYALLLLDLDHFKHINDSRGHQAGDRTLVKVAATLQQGLRPLDRVGRYGGEEFVALLPISDLASAQRMAERLRARVEGLPADTDTPACTVSIGVARVQAGDASCDAVVGRADRALYQAKAAGRNQVSLG
ncbi:MAG: GGDEF domain-containing protein [Curvibacter lanceolatus]|uniref:GGDEF domain-containing protein n=1 Tax=Curvibacter lanceolatus TaxID=86182 RepID=UPI002357BEA0|nr:GGDEF domain-containing protein [Curvibacter lanceolatus]MBV5294602.1 GGDEF domain-containing protein [Curvibacter lanceolatus]